MSFANCVFGRTLTKLLALGVSVAPPPHSAPAPANLASITAGACVRCSDMKDGDKERNEDKVKDGEVKDEKADDDDEADKDKDVEESKKDKKKSEDSKSDEKKEKKEKKKE